MTNRLRQFIKGMGSAIDLGATSSHAHTRVGDGLNLERTSADALGGDWRKLAEDFGTAFTKMVRDGGEHAKAK